MEARMGFIETLIMMVGMMLVVLVLLIVLYLLAALPIVVLDKILPGGLFKGPFVNKKATDTIVVAQIEMMKRLLVQCEGDSKFVSRKEKNYGFYRAEYEVNKDNRIAPIHTFLYKNGKDKLNEMTRFELLDYYHQAILPSKEVSEELKEAWVQQAKASWVWIDSDNK